MQFLVKILFKSVKAMSNEIKGDKNQNVPTFAKFVIAGLGGMGAALVVQPIDVIKYRMQVSGEGGAKRDHVNSLQAASNIVRSEGVSALYGGLTANLFRQVTYTTSRMGFYQAMSEWLKENGYSGFGFDVGAGLFSGFLAALISTPTDVTLVRMTTDGRLPRSERRNYRHVFDALYRIGKEEGVKGLWAGTVPTVARAMASNVTQLVSYSQFKRFFIGKGYMEDNTTCHLVCSTLSGFVYATVTSPLDTGKTRIQTMKSDKGVPLYTGLFDVWAKTVKAEGVTALWKGYVPYFARIIPATILLLIFCEKLTLLYKEYVMGISNPKGL